MGVQERSKAAEEQLDQLSAPFSVHARYAGLALARIVTRNEQFGDAAWKAKVRPRLERLEHPETIEVPRVRKEDLTPEVLVEATRCRTPIVLEGLISDSEAVKTWSPTFFRDNYGDVTVPLLMRTGGRNHVTIAEIIDGFGEHFGNDAPAINNATDFLMHNPELREAIPFELIREWSGEQLHGAQLFVGAKDCGTNWHCANEFNFFMMINGEKDWYLAHPRHTMWVDGFLDPRSGNYATATWERTTAWDEDPQGVPLMHAHLRPGDVLLNRPWWWHLVKNRTDAVGVSTRWHRWGFRFGTQNQMFSLLQWLVPHQWTILWNDYVRNDQLTDDKFLKAFTSHHAHYDHV